MEKTSYRSILKNHFLWMISATLILMMVFAYTQSADIYAATDLSGATVTLSDTSYTYSGSENRPTPTVVLGSKTLTPGTDYTVSYKNNIEVGTGTVVVTGTGDYTGTAQATFTISGIKLTAANTTITLSTETYNYNGKAKTPAVTVKYGSKTLTKGTDYTVAYKNNINAGKATAAITGKGNYTGTVNEYYTIKKVKQNLTVSIASKRIHLGKTRKLKLSSGSKKYKFTSSNKKVATVSKTGVVSAKKLGKTTITVKALADNNYYASKPKKITLEMVKTKISNGSFHVKLSKTKYTYNGRAKKPAVTLTSDAGLTLKKGKDYTVTYKNNKNAGKATVVVKGINNYGGTLKKKFTIKKATQTITARVSPATIRVGGSTKVKVTKKAGTPEFKSTQTAVATVDSSGKVTGKNVGSTTIKVVIPESRNYEAASTKVVVKVRRAKFSEANIKVKFSTRYYTYNGEAKYPSPKVYDGNIRMYEGNDYTISYKNNVAIGSARIIIKGINNYSGSLTKYFFIVPAETKFRTVKNSDSGTITCTWIPKPSITGYQIQYARNYNFNNAVLRLVRDPDATSFSITGLDTGVYFVRIRPYKYIQGDDTYVSGWSVPVKITVSQ